MNLLPITNRQRELLLHISNGLFYKEIAYLMGLSEGTVKMYAERMRARIRKKGFNVVNHASIVALALRQGWIQ